MVVMVYQVYRVETGYLEQKETLDQWERLENVVHLGP